MVGNKQVLSRQASIAQVRLRRSICSEAYTLSRASQGCSNACTLESRHMGSVYRALWKKSKAFDESKSNISGLEISALPPNMALKPSDAIAYVSDTWLAISSPSLRLEANFLISGGMLVSMLLVLLSETTAFTPATDNKQLIGRTFDTRPCEYTQTIELSSKPQSRNEPSKCRAKSKRSLHIFWTNSSEKHLPSCKSTCRFSPSCGQSNCAQTKLSSALQRTLLTFSMD
mmetsp:Transcript_3428/g.5707  ORF Transcript_3428/g.5707 Transcript_3428/m.5707 type:complete len:229 (+) Transcript_3428:65-751(+)